MERLPCPPARTVGSAARERSASSVSRPTTMRASTVSTLKMPPLRRQSSWMMRRTSTVAPARPPKSSDLETELENVEKIDVSPTVRKTPPARQAVSLYFTPQAMNCHCQMLY